MSPDNQLRSVAPNSPAAASAPSRTPAMFVGERPVVGAHAQRERQRLPCPPVPRPGVDVEQAHTLQQQYPERAGPGVRFRRGEIRPPPAPRPPATGKVGTVGSSNRLPRPDQSAAQVDLAHCGRADRRPPRHPVRNSPACPIRRSPTDTARTDQGARGGRSCVTVELDAHRQPPAWPNWIASDQSACPAIPTSWLCTSLRTRPRPGARLPRKSARHRRARRRGRPRLAPPER